MTCKLTHTHTSRSYLFTLRQLRKKNKRKKTETQTEKRLPAGTRKNQEEPGTEFIQFRCNDLLFRDMTQFPNTWFHIFFCLKLYMLWLIAEICDQENWCFSKSWCWSCTFWFVGGGRTHLLCQRHAVRQKIKNFITKWDRRDKYFQTWCRYEICCYHYKVLWFQMICKKKLLKQFVQARTLGQTDTRTAQIQMLFFWQKKANFQSI